jgi:pimeloyl-ACP methyl ester carboxylesterase
MGLETFLEKVLLSHADASRLEREERQAYLDDWSQPGALTAMLNWYRAAKIEVPAMGEEASLPLWARMPFPPVIQPALVVWGLKDKALLPVQLEGLNAHVNDLRLVTSATAGHFIPWEEPDTVTAAMREFLAEATA